MTPIEVRVRFFSHTEGGRKAVPELLNYRPHFVVPPSQDMLGVQFVSGSSDYQPNEEIVATVICLYEPGVSYEALSVGADFDILEGPRVVGRGTVIA